MTPKAAAKFLARFTRSDEKTIFHITLSMPRGMTLSDEDWLSVIRHVLAASGRRDHRLPERVGGVGLQMPPHCPGAIADPRLDPGNGIQNACRLVVVEPPGIRERHGAGRAGEQRRAKTLFKQLDLAAQERW